MPLPVEGSVRKDRGQRPVSIVCFYEGESKSPKQNHDVAFLSFKNYVHHELLCLLWLFEKF